VRAIEKAFQKAAKQVRNTQGKCGKVRFEGRLDYESFRLKKNDPSVVAAAAAVAAEGKTPDYTIANGGLDANWLSARGISTVTLGCGQNCIHTVDEWLDLVEFHRARRIALRLATAAE
jgi:tripeptide aminopeptidase